MRKRNFPKTAGFSLVELLVVVGILGVLSSIAILSYNKYVHTTRAVIVETEINEIEKAFELCYVEAISGVMKTKVNDCISDDINKYFKPNPKVVVTAHTDASSKKGCFSVKFNGASDDKSGKQCINFWVKDELINTVNVKGQKINHYKDDGIKEGICQIGVCK